MKKIIAVISVLIISLCSVAYASFLTSGRAAQLLGEMRGRWYDTSGNLILNIDNGNINGCEVTAVRYGAGGWLNSGYYFTVRERTGLRELQIGVHLAEGKEIGYGRYLSMRNYGTLTRR